MHLRIAMYRDIVLLFGASEVTTLRRYTHTFIVIVNSISDLSCCWIGESQILHSASYPQRDYKRVQKRDKRQ